MPKQANYFKVLAENRKAHYEYFIYETYEAGISLVGTEIKSVRKGQCSIKESFIRVSKNEVFIVNMNISVYDKGNIFNHEPTRERKLLLHKQEIKKLRKASQIEGYTIIPLKLIVRTNYAKLIIALAKGKKNYDKREADKIKSIQKEINQLKKSA
jgi:SsrA-binding protein